MGRVGSKKLTRVQLCPCTALILSYDDDTVVLYCGCQSDGREFPSTTRTLQKSGNLTIARLSVDDHGPYECVASNVIADIITATFIIIEGLRYHRLCTHAARVLLFSVVFVCVSVCLFVSQHDNFRTVRDIITKFSQHHRTCVIEMADKVENGYRPIYCTGGDLAPLMF